MKTYIFEVANGPDGPNWGKFLVGVPTGEWRRRSVVSPLKSPLLAQRGWNRRHIFVLDLETGEGAMFPHGPYSRAREDLNKHRIAVCVLYEAFLAWLYRQDLRELGELSKKPLILSVPGRTPGRRPGCASGVDDCASQITRLVNVVRWLLSNSRSPQGPGSPDRLPATAQADPGSPAGCSGPTRV